MGNLYWFFCGTNPLLTVRDVRQYLIQLSCAALLTVLVWPASAAAQPDQEVTVNWQEGRWIFSEAPQDAPKARLTFAGDWRPARVYKPLFEKDPTAAYGELLPVLRESDLRLVNVETTIGVRGAPIPKGGPNFQADPAFLKGLTAVPFEVALLANNHSADHGPPSIQETVQHLENVGLQTVGAGMSGEAAAQPLILNVKGTSVAVINCAEGEEGRSVRGGPGVNGMNVPAQVAQIRQLKDLVDLTVVVFHGGREHLPSPPPYVTYAMRSFARAGADAVIAHHPHVPQGIEVVNGAPIVYSQGNFIFWQTEDYYKQVGYLVHLDVSKGQVAEMSLTPYQQTPQGLVHLAEPHRLALMQDLKVLSDRLKQDGGVEALWNAFLDRVDAGTDQLKSVIQQVEKGNKKNGAYLHNLFFTPGHREMYIDGMKRFINGEMGTSPEWARQRLEQWLSRPASELPEAVPETQ